MAIMYRMTEEDGYLAFEFEGAYSFEEFMQWAEKVVAETRHRNKSHLLLDISKVVGKIDEYDRYRLGSRIAEVWGSNLKVALVDMEGDDSDFAQAVAQQGGAWFQCFPARTEAVQWLLEDNQRNEGLLPPLDWTGGSA